MGSNVPGSGATSWGATLGGSMRLGWEETWTEAMVLAGKGSFQYLRCCRKVL